MSQIWLSIGTNIDREGNLRAAIQSLRQRFGPLILSPVYETASVGFKGDPFYNMVVGCNSGLSAHETSAALKQIEVDQGRRRAQPKFSSRTIDIDLLTYEHLCINQGGLQIPRDEILNYAFVLKPLADVAPDHQHPSLEQSYAELWHAFSGDRQLIQIDFHW
jgi:2-amino-4-hydroxy-6-hydroxymethyldihydropteridine diphosphokinase